MYKHSEIGNCFEIYSQLLPHHEQTSQQKFLNYSVDNRAPSSIFPHNIILVFF